MKKIFVLTACILSTELYAIAGDTVQFWYPKRFIDNYVQGQDSAAFSVSPITSIKTVGLSYYFLGRGSEDYLKREGRKLPNGFTPISHVEYLFNLNNVVIEDYAQASFFYKKVNDSSLLIIIQHKYVTDTIEYIPSYQGYPFQSDRLTYKTLNFSGHYIIKKQVSALKESLIIYPDGKIDGNAIWDSYKIEDLAYYNNGDSIIYDQGGLFIITLLKNKKKAKKYIALIQTIAGQKDVCFYDFYLKKNVPVTRKLEYRLLSY